jgi:hypothetical protein
MVFRLVLQGAACMVLFCCDLLDAVCCCVLHCVSIFAAAAAGAALGLFRTPPRRRFLFAAPSAATPLPSPATAAGFAVAASPLAPACSTHE